MSIKVLSVDVFNLNDDVIFYYPSIVLYASGCKWRCKYCHSKNTWNFNQGYEFTVEQMKNILDDIFTINKDAKITIVGEGGDFWFQKEEWYKFCKTIRELYNNIKIIWFTGAEVEDVLNEKFIQDNVNVFDVILCGKPFYKENKHNIKDIYFVKDNTVLKGKIIKGRVEYLTK